MKVIALFLLFVTATFARTRPGVLDDVPERNADNGTSSSQYIQPCAVSPDGTYMSTDGDYIVVDYTFQMEYDRDYSVPELLQHLSKQIGNTIIKSIFGDLCQTRTRRKVVINESSPPVRRAASSNLANMIQGLDTNPNYIWSRDCPAINSSDSGCEVFSGAIKVFLHSPKRKLVVTEAGIIDSIVMVIKTAMDSGDAAAKVDGIEYLKFYSKAETNQKDLDEQAANDLEQDLMEDIASNLVSDQPGQQDLSSSRRNDKLKSVGWGVLGMSIVIVAAIGYRYNKAKRDSLSESEIEIEDVLLDGVGDERREYPIQDSVEVVYE
jgi:hypothetical protein